MLDPKIDISELIVATTCREPCSASVIVIFQKLEHLIQEQKIQDIFGFEPPPHTIHIMVKKPLTQKEWDFANKITKNTVVGEPVWIDKFPHDATHGKTESRLLVVGKYRIFTAHLTMLNKLKISKEAHIYDISQMGHLEGQDNVIEINFFRDDKHLFDIRFANTPSANIEQSVGLSVLFTVQCARMQISYKFPAQMLHFMPERSLNLLSSMPKPWERMLPAQAHVETYTAT